MLKKIGILVAFLMMATITPASATTTWVKPPTVKIVEASAHYTECYSQSRYEHAWMSVNAQHWDARWPYLVQTAVATGDRAGASHSYAYMDKAQIVLFRPNGDWYGTWTAESYARLDVRYLTGWALVANFHWVIPWAPDRSCTTPAVYL